MTQLAFEIAKKFESVHFEQAYGVKKVFLCWSTKVIHEELKRIEG